MSHLTNYGFLSIPLWNLLNIIIHMVALIFFWMKYTAIRDGYVN